MQMNKNYTALILACSILGLGAKKPVPEEMRMGIPLKSLGLHNIDNTPEPEYIEYEAKPPRPDRKGNYDPLDLRFPSRKENILRIYRTTDKKTDLTMPKYHPITGKQYDFYKAFSWFSDSVDAYSVGDVTNDGMADIVLKHGKTGTIITFCPKRKIFDTKGIINVVVSSDGTRMGFDYPKTESPPGLLPSPDSKTIANKQ